jgi:phage terminase large subunit GpA-like protein
MSDIIKCPECGTKETQRVDDCFEFACESWMDSDGFYQSSHCKDRTVSELRRKVSELEIASRRYERIRKMHAQEFADLFHRCIRDDIDFDSAIDCLIATSQ